MGGYVRHTSPMPRMGWYARHTTHAPRSYARTSPYEALGSYAVHSCAAHGSLEYTSPYEALGRPYLQVSVWARMLAYLAQVCEQTSPCGMPSIPAHRAYQPIRYGEHTSTYEALGSYAEHTRPCAAHRYSITAHTRHWAGLPRSYGLVCSAYTRFNERSLLQKSPIKETLKSPIKETIMPLACDMASHAM